MQEIPSVQSDNKGNRTMLDLTFALRFIVKSTAFMAHHQHLKPTGDFDVFLFKIPQSWLIPIHSIIGLVLALLLFEITIIGGIAIGKYLWVRGIAIGKNLWVKGQKIIEFFQKNKKGSVA